MPTAAVSPAEALHGHYRETTTFADGVKGESDDAVALIAGEPSALLLHLWGRPTDTAPATGGDVVALRLLRERIDMATS
mgnify:CR=1 FL=1